MTGLCYSEGITASGLNDEQSNSLNFRHLNGQNCAGNFDLYLQYAYPNNKTYFNGSDYYIQGGYFNGKCASITGLSATDYGIYFGHCALGLNRNTDTGAVLVSGNYGGQIHPDYGEQGLVYCSMDPTGGFGWNFKTQVNGTTTFFQSVYSNSDRQLKRNIQSIDNQSLERLFNVSDKLLKKFIWKQTGKVSYGFIAQELEQYIPEAIDQNLKGVKSVSYNMAYAKILASLIHKIKELEKMIKEREN